MINLYAGKAITTKADIWVRFCFFSPFFVCLCMYLLYQCVFGICYAPCRAGFSWHCPLASLLPQLVPPLISLSPCLPASLLLCASPDLPRLFASTGSPTVFFLHKTLSNITHSTARILPHPRPPSHPAACLSFILPAFELIGPR